MHALSTYFEQNDRLLAGEMSTTELAVWTVMMTVLGWAMMAALWVFAR